MLNSLILNVWCLLAINYLWSETIPFRSAFLVSLDIVDETKRGWGWSLEVWWEGGGGLVEVRQARWGCEWQLQTPVCETVKSEVYRCTLLWPVHTSETSCCSHHHPTNRFLFNTKLPRWSDKISVWLPSRQKDLYSELLSTWYPGWWFLPLLYSPSFPVSVQSPPVSVSPQSAEWN